MIDTFLKVTGLLVWVVIGVACLLYAMGVVEVIEFGVVDVHEDNPDGIPPQNKNKESGRQ